MNIFSSFIHNNRYRTELALILLAGSIAALALIKVSAMDPKWEKAALLGFAAISFLILISRREKFVFCLAIFLLPIQLDFNLIYSENPFMVRHINGFSITAVDMLFLFCYACWILRVVGGHNVRVRLYPKITLPFLFIFAWSFMGLKKASVSDALVLSSLWGMFKCGFVFLYAANNLKDRWMIYWAAGSLLLAGVGQAVIGIVQYIIDGTIGLGMLGEVEVFEMMAGDSAVSRIGGTLGHANQFAIFMGTLVQVNLALLFAKISRRMKFIVSIPFLLIVSGMILTFSRSGFSGMVLGGFLNSFFCLTKRTGNKAFSAILVAILILASLGMAFTLIEPLRQRFFEDDRGSADLRPQMRLVAKNIIRHHPLFGVGLNNYTSAIHRYDISPTAVSYDFPKPVHNEFLLIAAEQGIIVLCLFLFIISVSFSSLVSIGRSKTDAVIPYLGIGFIGAWIALGFQLQFDYTYVFFSMNIWFYLGFVQAAGELAKTPAKNGNHAMPLVCNPNPLRSNSDYDNK